MSSGFGPRGTKIHRGIDFDGALGDPIYAGADGEMVDVRGALKPGEPGWVGGFGGWMVQDSVIDGQKVSLVYGHLFPKDMLVVKGQKVKRGELIGRMGNNGDVVAGPNSDGSHLHLEVWPGGRLTGGVAVDPAPWLSL